MTKQAYLAALRQELQVYPWASDPARLDRYVRTASEDLHGRGPGFQFGGEASVRAWRSIGGRGRPTLKALRALPEGE